MKKNQLRNYATVVSISHFNHFKCFYIKFNDNQVDKTENFHGFVNLDCDKDGNLIGLEIIYRDKQNE